MLSASSGFGVTVALAAINRHSAAMARSMERLATGQKINRASDDPAGMAAADSLKAELGAITDEINRLIFEEKRLGAVEGAQSVIADLLLELSGIVVSAANRAGRDPGELAADQDQVDSILKTISHLAHTTTFEGHLIIRSRSSQALGLSALATGGELNLLTGDLERAQETVRQAVESMATSRAGVGIRQNEIQSTVAALRAKFEHVAAARSQIVDTDYAAEVAHLMRARVLREAAQFVAKLALEHNREMVTRLLA